MLEDDLGQCVQIKNVKRFCRHIKEFQSIGTSIYIERGHSFIVDDDFRYNATHWDPWEEYSPKIYE